MVCEGRLEQQGMRHGQSRRLHRLNANTNLARAAAAEWCVKSGYKLGKRAFERVWPQARENAGLERMGSPGRRPKLSN
jgi:hypothetical protein